MPLKRQGANPRPSQAPIITGHLNKRFFVCYNEVNIMLTELKQTERINFFMKKAAVRFLSVIGITVMTLGWTGCAYRPDVYQGNFTEQKDVDKLRVGMTPEQVKFVLGTPMLLDPLDNTKWYYVNYTRSGWNDPEFKTLVVIFDDDRLVKEITGDFLKSQKFYTPL